MKAFNAARPLGLVLLSLCFSSAPAQPPVAAPSPEGVHDIDTAGLQALLAERPDTVLIDVRTRSEINLLGGSIDPRFLRLARCRSAGEPARSGPAQPAVRQTSAGR